MKKKKEKSSSIKQLAILIVIGAIGYFVYTNFLKDFLNNSINIEASGGSAFGSSGTKDKNVVDGEGHTEDFWTNNKFKW